MTRKALETLRAEILRQIAEFGVSRSEEIIQREFAKFMSVFDDLNRPDGNKVTITIIDQDISKGIMHVDAVYEPKPGDELSPAQQMGLEMLQLATPAPTTTAFPMLPGPRSDQ